MKLVPLKIALVAAIALAAVGDIQPVVSQAQTNVKTYTFGAMFPLTGPRPRSSGI